MTGPSDASELSRVTVWIMLCDLIPVGAGMIWIIVRAVGKQQWYPPVLQPYIRLIAPVLLVINFIASPTKEDFLEHMLAAVSLFVTALYVVILLKRSGRLPS